MFSKKTGKVIGLSLMSGIIAVAFSNVVFAEDNNTAINQNSSVTTGSGVNVTTGSSGTVNIGTHVQDEFNNDYEVLDRKEDGTYIVKLKSVNHPAPYCQISVEFEKDNIKYELENYMGSPLGWGNEDVYKCYSDGYVLGSRYDVIQLVNLDEKYSKNFYLNKLGITPTTGVLINDKGIKEFYSVATSNERGSNSFWIFKKFTEEKYPDYDFAWSKDDGAYRLVKKGGITSTTNSGASSSSTKHNSSSSSSSSSSSKHHSSSSSTSSSSSSSSSTSSSSTDTNKAEISNNNDKISKVFGGSITSSSTSKGLNGSDITISNITKEDGTKGQIISTSKAEDKIKLSSENGTKVYKVIEGLGLYVPVTVENNQDGTFVSVNENSTYFVVNSDITNGVVQKGWNKIDNTWIMVNDKGELAKGWYKDSLGSWYMLDNDGKMKTGWYEDTDGKWYLLNSSGQMTKGWNKATDGKWYYMNEQGAMLYDTYVGKYHLGSDGAYIE